MKLRVPAAVLALCALTACDDKTRSDLLSPEPVTIQAVAAGAAQTAAIGVQGYTLGILVGESAKPGGTRLSALGDTLLPGVLTCPVVTAEPTGSGFRARFDYGTGCASKLDGVTTRGRIDFTAALHAPSGLDLTAEFTGFARGGVTVDGILTLSGRTGEGMEIGAQALGVTAPGSTLLFNMELSAERVLTAGAGAARKVEPSYCAAWRIPSGAGSVEGVVGSDEIAFLVSVSDTVMCSTCCAYPTEGVVLVTASGWIPAIVDFGDGACDNKATLTIAGRSQEITLGN